MMNQNSITPIIEDAYNFSNILASKYGIQMQLNPVRKLNIFNLIGEFRTYSGLPMLLSITVYPSSTEIKVYTGQKQCVYQKSYKTLTDNKALTKSTGLFNFIEKAYKTM